MVIRAFSFRNLIQRARSEAKAGEQAEHSGDTGPFGALTTMSHTVTKARPEYQGYSNPKIKANICIRSEYREYYAQ